jgi:hypothetical protein
LGFREGTAFSRADKATACATARLKSRALPVSLSVEETRQQMTPDYPDETKGMG